MKSPLVKDSGAIEQELGIFVRLPETAHKTALGYLKMMLGWFLRDCTKNPPILLWIYVLFY
jgi:hypothetical protein